VCSDRQTKICTSPVALVVRLSFRSNFELPAASRTDLELAGIRSGSFGCACRFAPDPRAAGLWTDSRSLERQDL
jgi:hypothetical protein